MTANDQWKQNTSDPLGLSKLDLLEPDFDGWSQVESALLEHQQSKSHWRKTGGWLAVAASLLLVLGISLRNTETQPGSQLPSDGFATQSVLPASVPVKDPVENDINALIGLSQNMEEQVKKLRQKTNSMPAESAIYIAELEDLIAQVDSELSQEPGSIDLWGQRVNLMLDLAQIYQQQWQIDYGRMASL